MTNAQGPRFTNPIQAQNLEHGDMIIDEEDNRHIVNNIRRIDHERVRITTSKGHARVVTLDHLFELDNGI